MRNEMQDYRLWKGIKMGVLVVMGCIVLGFGLMWLWNWLMPGIFHLGTITFWQALGLFVLSKLLFGGVHHNRGGRGGRGWKRHMEERWAGMSAEERERFQAGMRGGRGRWCRPRPDAGPEARGV